MLGEKPRAGGPRTHQGQFNGHPNWKAQVAIPWRNGAKLPHQNYGYGPYLGYGMCAVQECVTNLVKSQRQPLGGAGIPTVSAPAGMSRVTFRANAPLD